MHSKGTARGFCIGVVVGLTIGSAGLAAAAFGYKGWSRFSQDFRVGYITGFLDMANLARNLDPGGYLDQKYPMVPNTKPMVWYDEVTRLYEKPENQGYTITSLMQLASHELEKKYGKALDPHERTRQRMEMQLEALRRKREAMGLVPKDPTTQAIAPDKVVKDFKVPAKPKEKKWCRCDGKDPKAERARRRAEAEEREKQEERELMENAAKAKAAGTAGTPATGVAPAAPAGDAKPAPADPAPASETKPAPADASKPAAK